MEVITRDRWSAFAQAANEGAPKARQVADRWHLLKNLREAVERVLGRLSPEITKVVRQTTPAEPATPGTGGPVPAEAVAPAPPPAPVSARERARQAKKQAREQRHRLVRELRDQGHSIRATARQTGLSTGAVIRYRRRETCPDWKPGRRGRTRVDQHRADVEQRISGGGRNTRELHRLWARRGARRGTTRCGGT